MQQRCYVAQDTSELAGRDGTSSTAAVVVFWVLVGAILAMALAFALAAES